MRNQETLSEEIRRGSYGFVLSIYEALERLPFQSVLVKDIESHANWFLTLVARYPVSTNKGQNLKDIIAELKGIRALLGVLRDTNALVRQPAKSLLLKCEAVDLAFSELEPESAIISIPELRPRGPEEAKASWVPRVPKPEVRRESTPHIEAPQQREVVAEQSLPEAASSPTEEISLRQKAILEVLKRRDKTTVGELGLLFSGKVSKKTLQRDLVDLVARRIIGRVIAAGPRISSELRA